MKGIFYTIFSKKIITLTLIVFGLLGGTIFAADPLQTVICSDPNEQKRRETFRDTGGHGFDPSQTIEILNSFPDSTNGYTKFLDMFPSCVLTNALCQTPELQQEYNTCFNDRCGGDQSCADIKCIDICTQETPQCGSANRTASLNAPTTNLCAIGNPSSTSIDIASFEWQCSTPSNTVSCYAPRMYTVTFNANGGAEHNPTTKNIVYSMPIGTLPTAPVRPGYVFNGRGTTSTGGTQISAVTMVFGNMTVYARWTLLTNSCTPYTGSAHTNLLLLGAATGISVGGTFVTTGNINENTALRISITNLANTEQFVQYAKPIINNIPNTGNIVGGNFYGCQSTAWNVSNPLTWAGNLGLTSMMVAPGDALRGFVYANNTDSQFVAWNKANKGFRVDCSICTTIVPVTSQTGACVGLPANAVPNIATTITQYTGTAGWTPSTGYIYNPVVSTGSCNFVCATNYTRNGSACIPSTTGTVCGGTLPANATSLNGNNNFTQTRNGTNRSPISNTRTYSETGSVNPLLNECKFTCANGYVRDGSTCRAINQTGTCSGTPPANTTLVGSTTFTQTWNGSTYNPVSIPYTYTADTNSTQACTYTCPSATHTRNATTQTCTATPIYTRHVGDRGQCPINGICGAAHQTSSATIPNSTTLCLNGTPTGLTGTGPWSWSCAGTNGGTTISCNTNTWTASNNACIGTYTRTWGGSCSGTITQSSTAPSNGACMASTVCGGWGGDLGGGVFCGEPSPGQIAACSSHTSASSCNAQGIYCGWVEMGGGTTTTTCESFNGGYNVLNGSLTFANPQACVDFGCNWTSESEIRVCSDFVSATTSSGVFGPVPGCDSQPSCTWGPQTNPPQTNREVGQRDDSSCSMGLGTSTRTVICPSGFICPLTQPDTSRTCSASPTGKVICGELHRQGYLSEEVRLADNLYATEFINEQTVALYHRWAKPLVYAMQQSSLVTQIVKPYGIGWAEHMAYNYGTIEKNNYLGYLLHSTFLPLHDYVAGASSEGSHTIAKAEFDTVGLLLFIALCIFLLCMIGVILLPIVIVSYFFIPHHFKVLYITFTKKVYQYISILAIITLLLAYIV